MSNKPYDYSTRSGLLPISWEDFHGICKALARAVATYQPEIILPIGRGGYYPGTLIAHLLQAEIYPVRLSRRINDQVKFQQPQWLLEPPALVRGKRVLTVDEICSSGETLQMVQYKVTDLGASEIRSAVMYAHTGGTDLPNYIGIITDALILNPWDREIYTAGSFQLNPEYAQAMKLQNIETDPSVLIQATPYKLAKG